MRPKLTVQSDFAARVKVTLTCTACGVKDEREVFCSNQGLDTWFSMPDGWTMAPWQELVCPKHRMVVVDKEGEG